MAIYTVDLHVYSRRLITPSKEQFSQLVYDGGNNKFEFVGNDEMSRPLISCENKPKDSALYGIRWVKKHKADY